MSPALVNVLYMTSYSRPAVSRTQLAHAAAKRAIVTMPPARARSRGSLLCWAARAAVKGARGCAGYFFLPAVTLMTGQLGANCGEGEDERRRETGCAACMCFVCIKLRRTCFPLSAIDTV